MRRIEHKDLGKGTVKSENKDYMTVNFDNGAKTTVSKHDNDTKTLNTKLIFS